MVSFVRRLAGHAIELSLPLVFFGGLLLIMVGAAAAVRMGIRLPAGPTAALALGALFTGWFILVGFQVFFDYHRGCSWGKRLLGLQVVGLAGERPGFLRMIKRDEARLLSILCCGLGYLWMLWDPEQQTWHDKFARTRVIRNTSIPLCPDQGWGAMRLLVVWSLIASAVLMGAAWLSDHDKRTTSAQQSAIDGPPASTSTEAMECLRRGEAAAAQHDTSRAIQEYSRAIELDPQCAKAYAYRGGIYSKNGQHREAIQDYDRSIELAPKEAETYNNRGVAFHRQESYDRAIEDFTRALDLDQGSADSSVDRARTLSNRGEAYSRKRDFSRALQGFDEALRLDPDQRMGYYFKAGAYQGMGRTPDALSAYREFIARNPADASEEIEIARARVQELDGKSGTP